MLCPSSNPPGHTNLQKGSSVSRLGRLLVGMSYKLSSPYADIWVAHGMTIGYIYIVNLVTRLTGIYCTITELPAHVRPVTPTHVLLLPLYLQPRFLTYSYSALNVLNHYASIYLV